MPSYDDELSQLPEEVSFGVTTIRIGRPGDLGQLQVGFSVDARGNPLFGDSDGSWRPTWIVVGIDDTCGDPIFIDATGDGFPVFTAMHGQGRWQPVQIASSLAGLGQALAALSDASRDREDPIALRSNPLGKEDREVFLSRVRQHNPGVSLGFWADLLDAS
jgi:hypothetical protein